MDISAAALPPIHGPITEQDRKHPRFPEYQHWRANMARLLVRADGFKDWLYQQEQSEYRDSWASHERYPEFLSWMRETKAGARKCPAGNVFPENFKHWLSGGRW